MKTKFNKPKVKMVPGTFAFAITLGTLMTILPAGVAFAQQVARILTGVVVDSYPTSVLVSGRKTDATFYEVDTDRNPETTDDRRIIGLTKPTQNAQKEFILKNGDEVKFIDDNGTLGYIGPYKILQINGKNVKVK